MASFLITLITSISLRSDDVQDVRCQGFVEPSIDDDTLVQAAAPVPEGSTRLATEICAREASKRGQNHDAVCMQCACSLILFTNRPGWPRNTR
jgi:hypothetical protein